MKNQFTLLTNKIPHSKAIHKMTNLTLNISRMKNDFCTTWHIQEIRTKVCKITDYNYKQDVKKYRELGFFSKRRQSLLYNPYLPLSIYSWIYYTVSPWHMSS